MLPTRLFVMKIFLINLLVQTYISRKKESTSGLFLQGGFL